MADFSPLRGVQACVFDAYGTLFDFAAAARKVLGDDTSFINLWRDKQLQYTWLRAAQERHADFGQVTGDALDFALDTRGLNKPGIRDQLISLFVTLDPFPEVPNVLRKLKTAGMRTAILSNGTGDAQRRGQGSQTGTVAGCGPFGRGGWRLQTAPKGVPAGGRSSCHSCIGNHLRSTVARLWAINGCSRPLMVSFTITILERSRVRLRADRPFQMEDTNGGSDRAEISRRNRPIPGYPPRSLCRAAAALSRPLAVRDINSTEAGRLSWAVMPKTKRYKHKEGRHLCTRIPR